MQLHRRTFMSCLVPNRGKNRKKHKILLKIYCTIGRGHADTPSTSQHLSLVIQQKKQNLKERRILDQDWIQVEKFTFTETQTPYSEYYLSHGERMLQWWYLGLLIRLNREATRHTDVIPSVQGSDPNSVQLEMHHAVSEVISSWLTENYNW